MKSSKDDIKQSTNAPVEAPAPASTLTPPPPPAAAVKPPSKRSLVGEVSFLRSNKKPKITPSTTSVSKPNPATKQAVEKAKPTTLKMMEMPTSKTTATSTTTTSTTATTTTTTTTTTSTTTTTPTNHSIEDIVKQAQQSLYKNTMEIAEQNGHFVNSEGVEWTLKPFQIQQMKEYAQAQATKKSNTLDAVFELPTGVGKTVELSTILANLYPTDMPKADLGEMKTIIFVPTRSLIKQTKTKLKGIAPHLKVGELKKGKNKKFDLAADLDVFITTYNHFDKEEKVKQLFPDGNQHFQFVVFDEAHRLTAEKRAQAYKDRVKNKVNTIALTATTEYAENKSVYHVLGYRHADENPVKPVKLIDAIEQKALSSVRVGRVVIDTNVTTQARLNDISRSNVSESTLGSILNRPEYNLACVKTYCTTRDEKNGDPLFGQQTMVPCAGIQHAFDMAKLFNDTIKIEEHPPLIAARDRFHALMRREHQRKRLKYNKLSAEKKLKDKDFIKYEFYNLEFDTIMANLAENKFDKKYGKLYELHRYQIATDIHSESNLIDDEKEKLQTYEYYVSTMEPTKDNVHIFPITENGYIRYKPSQNGKEQLFYVSCQNGKKKLKKIGNMNKKKFKQLDKLQLDQVPDTELLGIETGQLENGLQLTEKQLEEISKITRHTVGKKQKLSDTLIKKCRYGGILIVTGSSMLKEGLDVPNMSVELNWSGTRSKLDRTQELGRILRLKQNGCSLHLLDDLPDNLIKYSRSYILAKDTLFFITESAAVEKVHIENMHTFRNELAAVRKNAKPEIPLDGEQIFELITKNGGHKGPKPLIGHSIDADFNFEGQKFASDVLNNRYEVGNFEIVDQQIRQHVAEDVELNASVNRFTQYEEFKKAAILEDVRWCAPEDIRDVNMSDATTTGSNRSENSEDARARRKAARIKNIQELSTTLQTSMTSLKDTMMETIELVKQKKPLLVSATERQRERQPARDRQRTVRNTEPVHDEGMNDSEETQEISSRYRSTQRRELISDAELLDQQQIENIARLQQQSRALNELFDEIFTGLTIEPSDDDNDDYSDDNSSDHDSESEESEETHSETSPQRTPTATTRRINQPSENEANPTSEHENSPTQTNLQQVLTNLRSLKRRLDRLVSRLHRSAKNLATDTDQDIRDETHRAIEVQYEKALTIINQMTESCARREFMQALEERARDAAVQPQLISEQPTTTDTVAMDIEKVSQVANDANINNNNNNANQLPPTTSTSAYIDFAKSECKKISDTDPNFMKGDLDNACKSLGIKNVYLMTGESMREHVVVEFKDDGRSDKTLLNENLKSCLYSGRFHKFDKAWSTQSYQGHLGGDLYVQRMNEFVSYTPFNRVLYRYLAEKNINTYSLSSADHNLPPQPLIIKMADWSKAAENGEIRLRKNADGSIDDFSVGRRPSAQISSAPIYTFTNKRGSVNTPTQIQMSPKTSAVITPTQMFTPITNSGTIVPKATAVPVAPVVLQSKPIETKTLQSQTPFKLFSSTPSQPKLFEQVQAKIIDDLSKETLNIYEFGNSYIIKLKPGHINRLGVMKVQMKEGIKELGISAGDYYVVSKNLAHWTMLKKLIIDNASKISPLSSNVQEYFKFRDLIFNPQFHPLFSTLAMEEERKKESMTPTSTSANLTNTDPKSNNTGFTK